MVRKGEAGTASAFFANEDVLSITADNDDDPRQQASAEILKELIQYRLTKTIPWFLTIVGARQDAEVMGMCVAKAFWQYEERFAGTRQRPKLDTGSEFPSFGDDGEPEVEEVDLYEQVKDRPWVELLAPENIRFDPGCDWRDPVHSSPYIIELIPMYVQDVLERIQAGEWKSVPLSALRDASDISDDSTRRTREAGRLPGQDKTTWRPAAFDICWVRSNIIRWAGRDYIFYTLSSAGVMLTDPEPLEKVHLHGERPYVCGYLVVETHKCYPGGKVELTKDLQRIANDDLNLRFDAVKMNLQPRQIVKATAGVELNDLRTFSPGKIVIMKGEKGEPANASVAWDRPPEPGNSAYQEQQFNQLDWDDLTGAFTNSSVQASQWAQQSATGMHLMSGEASGLNEYELRIFAETFVEPLLRLLIKLEQAYETNETIIGIAAQKAGLFQRYGISRIEDDLLQGAVTTRVNVGIGATNPSLKLKQFGMAADIVERIFSNPSAAMGLQFHEIIKEVFGNAGFRDGERFVKPGFDPQQAMMQMEQAKGQKGGGNTTVHPDEGPAKIEAARLQAQSRMQEVQERTKSEQMRAQLDLRKQMIAEQAETQRVRMQIEAQRAQTSFQTQADAAQSLREHFMRLHQSHQDLQGRLHEQHQQAMHAHEANARGMQDMVRSLNRPKKVKRGLDGKVSGIE